jgi:N-acetylglucosaminyldiphosphoundecaprenol N-acetyl-beta-D-mannosaminyltransferase
MIDGVRNLKRVFFNGVELCDEPVETILSIIKNYSHVGFSYIVTPNIDHFCRLDVSSDDLYKLAYNNADLKVCDSRIVQKLSMFEAESISNVVPGSDLTEKLLESSWARTAKILIVGPVSEDVESIKKKYNLLNVESYSPPMGFIGVEAEVVKCVNLAISSAANIILLAVGSPQQEILAYRLKMAPVKVRNKGAIVLCVGASLDFLSGKAKRAPRLMQVLHFEWLHRACSNPRRLVPRYWKNFTWIFSYFVKSVSLKFGKS